MTRETFDLLRLPVAVVLLLIAGVVLFPRGPEGAGADDRASPSPTPIVARPGGVVTASEPQTGPPAGTERPDPPATSTPEPTPEPTPSPTAEPTPESPPAQPDGFTAEVLACRSISGATCNGQLGTLPAGAGSFTALVRFTDANAGDTMNAILAGPSGTIPGGAFTLQGSGDGYYYTTFQAGGLPGGSYTITATRNGTEVAVTTFRIAGG